MLEYIRFSRAVQIVMLCLLLSLVVSQVGAAEKKSYTLAIIPNLPAVTTDKNWTPLAEHLSRKLGIKVELKLYDKLETFIEDTKAGQADFIFSSPNLFYLAYQKQKYAPLVRSSIMFGGRVFVKKDSPYTKVSDLQGKTIAFVGPKTVCAYIALHALNCEQNKFKLKAIYGGSTINVAKSVLLGKADAGATLDISMMQDIPEMGNEFRTILETDKIAPHPLAAHPRVPKKIQEAVTAEILALNSSEIGRKILETTRLSSPVKANFKQDYSLFDRFRFEVLEKQLENKLLVLE
jgi:phosphonate transport system substrate-binding protein